MFLAEIIAAKGIPFVVEKAHQLGLEWGIRRKESLSVRQQLQDQLGWSRGRSERRRRIRELAQSFSIYVPGSDERWDANRLLVEIVSHLTDKRREGFMIASESGSGKTVLAMLLPLLCEQFKELNTTALYLGRQDWATKRLPTRVTAWLSSCSPTARKLVIFDSLDEHVGDGSFGKLLTEVRAHSPQDCGFVVLFRPLSARYAEEISVRLASQPEERPLELRLEFNLSVPRQCAAFCHWLPNLTPTQASYLLRGYSDKFPDYRPTRSSAALILQYLVDRFQNVGAPQQGELLLRSPGDVIFDTIVGSQIDLNLDSLALLSRVAFEILKDGAQFEPIPFVAAKLGESPSRLVESLGEARQRLAEKKSRINITVNADVVRIPSETDVQVLAAVHIARLFVTRADEGMSEELKQLCGTARYDVCAQFILPAYQRIATESARLFDGIDGFLDREDASFSFIARFIHSSQDSSLLERPEELNSKLFRKLIEAIDRDRRKTCHESIRDSPTGPNPILDQLFAVVAAYRDSVVRLLVNHVLLASREDLEKSQGAYLILDWLKKLFGPRTTEAVLIERRHRIYTVLSGLELLCTENLHVRFHVMEVLDFLRSKKRDLQSMPDFSRRLDGLLQRYGEVTEPAKDSGLAGTYARCKNLLSAWANALRTEESQDRSVDELLPPLLASFRESAEYIERTSTNRQTAEIELFLECYEMLLGMVRRAALRFVRQEYLNFMWNAVDSPFWIVRWWAFYNIKHLVVSLPSHGEYKSIVKECLEWMVEQVYRGSEPVGLKHRQCALLESAIEERPSARPDLRELFDKKGSLDETEVEKLYASLLGPAGDRAAAKRSLDDYFRKVRVLSRNDH